MYDGGLFWYEQEFFLLRPEKRATSWVERRYQGERL
jgi:hypothetical protein